MRQTFQQHNFSDERRAMVDRVNGILTHYWQEDIRVTLRQLFYRLVGANVIPNTERSYKNLGTLVSQGRLAGLIDWQAIEDRVRKAERHAEFESLADLARAALYSWRLPRWNTQPKYVELWCEKDALSSVLAPITANYHVTLMVNRGYSSSSAMYESACRLNERGDGKDKVVLYLGDHDPSGEDMVRDVRDRLTVFRVDCLEVRKVALTREQVDEHDLPPNPARTTDARFRQYQEEHGNHSWEVDALPPEVLEEIVEEAIEAEMDMKAYRAVIARETKLATTFRRTNGVKK